MGLWEIIIDIKEMEKTYLLIKDDTNKINSLTKLCRQLRLFLIFDFSIKYEDVSLQKNLCYIQISGELNGIIVIINASMSINQKKNMLSPFNIEYHSPDLKIKTVSEISSIIQQGVQQNIIQKLYSILNELTPDDIGKECLGNYCVRFEGFTDMCWADVEERGISIPALEKEIISDWQERDGFVDKNIIEQGWYTADIFYCIYKKNIKKEDK